MSANDEQAAYLCGVLWEVCAEKDVAAAVVACGGVPIMLHTASRFLPYVATKSEWTSEGVSECVEE